MAKGSFNPRVAAAIAISDVLDSGRSLDVALARAREDGGADASLSANLAFGAMRHRSALEFLLARLVNKPLARRDRVVHALLLAGLFERWQLSTPAHAAVSETVGALRALRKPGLKGLVNAVLRRFDRERAALLADLAAQSVAVRTSHPQWLMDTLATDWPDRSDAIVHANNERAPMWLRVNSARLAPAGYVASLEANGIRASRPGSAAPAAVLLHEPVAVEALPGFSEGLVSVQDLAPQLAAPMLGAEPGMRVLDACAAPGGKTAHLQELANNQLDLLALDIDAHRLERVAETLDRLHLEADLIAADAAQVHEWWDGQPFDRILIDAPCTATGVIRRHPDIKWLRRESDVAALAQHQQELLRALWPTLAPGGCLVYATCSVLKLENSEVIAAFCRDIAPSVRVDELRTDNIKGVMRSGAGGLQILPGTQGADGFFLSRLWRPA